MDRIGWKSFEDLCVSIARLVWGVEAVQFHVGKDGGRDSAIYGQITKGLPAGPSVWTIQCKHTSKPEKSITLSTISGELDKIESLYDRGLSDGYILVSNYNLTAENEAIINKEIRKRGPKLSFVFGREWVEGRLLEESKLRMHVPRVYGLGDLTQILAERAYRQAEEILGIFIENVPTFVTTEAYASAAKAIDDHGFVLLVGEPASGKTTIGSALALAAVDNFGVQPVKVDKPEVLRDHWNPDEQQFLWVDDAFGSTQVDASRVEDWNALAPHLMAAIKRGTRVVMTSRDYIFDRAKNSLKKTAFPILHASTVVVRVQDLTEEEKSKILYNHLKFGNQNRDFIRSIKPCLQYIASHDGFLPEIARRLGDRTFTKHLSTSKESLLDFVARPEDFLLELLEGLDRHSQTALVLIFCGEGGIASPIKMDSILPELFDIMGSSLSDIIDALESLDGSLVELRLKEGVYRWEFKHPTMQDAIATYLARSPEKLTIWLKYAPLNRIMAESWCDENDHSHGVIIPASLYPILVERIEWPAEPGDFRARNTLVYFLTERCGEKFLREYSHKNQACKKELRIDSPIHGNQEAELAMRLIESGIDVPGGMEEIIEACKEDILWHGEIGILNDDKIKSFLGPEKWSELEEVWVTELDDHFLDIIINWDSNCPSDSNIEEYYKPLQELVDELGKLGKKIGTELSVTEYHERIEESMWEETRRREEESERHYERYDVKDWRSSQTPATESAKEPMGDHGIFSDVDQ